MVHIELKETFLSLVRLGIGHSVDALPQTVDWNEVQALAEKQGLYAVVMDAVEKLPVSLRPPQIQLLEWIGEVLIGYEYRSDMNRRTIAEMAGFYNGYGYKMMILKGYACSLDWPRPKHRPCGDIDIWLFGQQKAADALLTKEKGIEVDNSHHHHTVFNWGDFMVENHYDFINVHHHKSHRALEKILKELGKDDSHSVVVNGEKVYLPSPNLHALFLMKHLTLHFSMGEISLRQVLDWAFFVKKHGAEVDWQWLLGVLDDFGMTPAFNIFNAICVEDLGFDASIFPEVQFNPIVKEKVLADILDPAFVAETPRHLIPRLIFKYRRWRGNAWKHELCYKESLWNAFCSGVWNHLLKPSSI